MDNNYTGGVNSRALRTIDVAAKAIGSAIDLPETGYYLYQGNNDYDILLGDNDSIYGFTFGEDDAEKILNWVDSDILNNYMEAVIMLPDGRIVCAQQSYDSMRAINQMPGQVCL